MSSASLVLERTPQFVRIPLLRKAASFPVMLSGLLVVLAVLTVRSRFDDPDLWWHLKMGQVIFATRVIPVNDLFSYTTNHHSYVAHEWLSQLLLYGAYQWAGYSGLMLWLCLITSALLIAGYALCSIYSGNAKVAFLGALTIWLFSTIGLSLRPQMVGYLLLMMELLLIHLGQHRSPRWLLALPPLFAIWVNCHGSFVLGLVVAATILISSFFTFEKGLLVAPRFSPRQRRWLSISLSLSVAALFLNPGGLKAILYPIDTLLHQPIGLSEVSEWQALQLNDGRGLALLVVLCCIFLIPIIRGSKLYLEELLILALGTFAAVSHQRMLFVFGILVAPILSRLLSEFWEGYDPDHDRPLVNAVFLVVSLGIAYRSFPSRAALESQVAQQSPVNAVLFMKSHHLSGPMLNDYVFGGYLIWAAPEHPVFIDGRADIFEWTGVFGEFGRWAKLQSDPNLLLDKYHISFCLLSRESPMSTVLPLLPQWRLAFSDDRSVIYTRVPSHN